MATCFSLDAILYHNMYYFMLANVCYAFGRNENVRKNSILHTILWSTFNFECLAGAVMVHSCFYGHTETETPFWFIMKLFGCRILADVWFYTAHRILHTAWFFRFHNIHHQWQDPISFAAFYAHPLENMLGNLFTILFAFHILQPSHVLANFWIAIVLTQSVLSHSGHLNFGLFEIKATHDDHHHHYNCDYGNSLFMDRLFKTRYIDRQKTADLLDSKKKY
jgi:sterol desaturase/sphingolipid hydroxylase (fatty acid hydroxylase superfamily)